MKKQLAVKERTGFARISGLSHLFRNNPKIHTLLVAMATSYKIPFRHVLMLMKTMSQNVAQQPGLRKKSFVMLTLHMLCFIKNKPIFCNNHESKSIV